MGSKPVCLRTQKGWLLFVLGCVAWMGCLDPQAMAETSFLPKRLPGGWVLREGPRTFTRSNLFRHIDGQAELFFKYGFRRSVFAVYQESRNPENQIDLDIYDMGNVLQAFGIFSRHRHEDRPGGVGLDSYVDERSAFFYKGKYFVLLYSTHENPSTLKAFASAVDGAITDRSQAPPEIGFFPREDLLPGSIQYFPEGLLGYQFLQRGFKASYGGGPEVLTLFFAIFRTPEEARRALASYRDSLLRKGKVDSQGASRFGPTAIKGEDPYQGQLIALKKGPFLLGAVGPQIGALGEKRLRELLENLP